MIRCRWPIACRHDSSLKSTKVRSIQNHTHKNEPSHKRHQVFKRPHSWYTTTSMQVASTMQSPPSRLAGTKRSVDDSSPALSRKDAAIAFRRLLSALPRKPKRQSLYVRFKYVLLQDASVKGDVNEIANITDLAKEKWKLVKNIDTSTPHLGKENADKYLVDAKRRAEADELLETQTHSKTLKEWCERFHTAASAHLSYLSSDIDERNFHELKDAIAKVESIREWSRHVPKFHLFALAKAKEELEAFQTRMVDSALVHKLYDANTPDLFRHARDYREKVEQAKELESVKAQLHALKYEREMELRQERELDQKVAANLLPDIVKNIAQQMTYDSTLKRQSKKVVYQRSGIKDEVFSAAFNVARGAKKAIIAARLVPCKLLQYGASLECGNVDVTLATNGDLVASAWYRMNSNHPSRFRS